MTFVGYIPHHESSKERLKRLEREKEREARKTPKERREEKELDDKILTVTCCVILFFAILFIAFIVWISHY
jgi:hypothetical protein